MHNCSREPWRRRSTSTGIQRPFRDRSRNSEGGKRLPPGSRIFLRHACDAGSAERTSRSPHRLGTRTMSLRFLVFGSLFGIAIVAAVFNPFWGILAYFGHYYLWPEHQWWGTLLAETGIRVSLSIAIVTASSVLLHWPALREKLAGPVISSQEVILWIYIGVIGLSEFWGLPADQAMDPVAAGLFTKMAKVGVLLFMLTHVVT